MARERLDSVDCLRGIVMVLMALDHARDYFGDLRADPTNLETTTTALFLTRWVTHFCAPTFVFLAGVGAFFYGARGRTKGELTRFLVSRGLWLIVLEFTVVHFAWMNTFTFGLFLSGVVAAIGFAMVVLGALVHLRHRTVAAIGAAIVVGHNLFDGLAPSGFGSAGWIWRLLHEGSMADNQWIALAEGGPYLMVVYPLLPWVGVLALGYAFGPVLLRERAARRRWCFGLGVATCVAFVVVRWLGGYGNPTPFAPQDGVVDSVLSFLNCTKYPPSLAYLAMTLGPMLVALALVDRDPARGERGVLGRACVTFGRVPLFYYVAHLFLIHEGSRALYRVLHGRPWSAMVDAFQCFFTGAPFPDWFPHPLWSVYVAWGVCVVLLYPLCRWFAGVKARGRSGWLSYL